MLRVITSAILSLYCAQLSADGYFFYQTIHNRLIFENVQIVRRNENVGVHVERKVVFEKWIKIAQDAWIGIESNDQIMLVLDLGDRRIGKPLSSLSKMSDIFLASNGVLTAIDERGEVFQYRQEAWDQSSLKSIVHRGGLGFLLASCATMGAVIVNQWFFAENTFSSLNSCVAPILVGVVSSGLISAFWGLRKYELDNEMPNGFVTTGRIWADFRIEQEIFSRSDGWLSDYLFNSSGKEYSLARELRSLSQGIPHDFRPNCNDQLIARGVPERDYR